jgi:hypothetical protein
MCVIYACYAGTPEDRELEDGAAANKDGAGICWTDMKGIKGNTNWIKGLKSDVEEVKKVIANEKIGFPYAIHFRSASIGPATGELTHPFPITQDAELLEEGTCRRVLMHNGHVGDWKNFLTPILLSSREVKEIPEGPWSDSRALAVACALKGETVLDLVATGSRVLVMDSESSRGMKRGVPFNHLRFYGSWIKHEKEGFYQSCGTPSKSIEVWRGHGNSRRYEPTNNVCQGVFPKAPEAGNSWTLKELEELAAEVRQEQEETKLLIGE